MSITATELDADLADIESDMPSVCVITQNKRQQTVEVCSVGEIGTGQSATDEGIFSDDSTPVTIRSALLEWVPTSGALVAVAGRKLRCMRVRSVDGDAAITLECEAESKP